MASSAAAPRITATAMANRRGRSESRSGRFRNARSASTTGLLPVAGALLLAQLAGAAHHILM